MHFLAPSSRVHRGRAILAHTLPTSEGLQRLNAEHCYSFSNTNTLLPSVLVSRRCVSVSKVESCIINTTIGNLQQRSLAHIQLYWRNRPSLRVLLRAATSRSGMVHFSSVTWLAAARGHGAGAERESTSTTSLPWC